MTQGLLLFLAGTVIDILYVALVAAIQARRAGWSAFISVALSAIQLLGYVQVTTTTWLCAPFLAGMGLGAYISVRWLQDVPRAR